MSTRLNASLMLQNLTTTAATTASTWASSTTTTSIAPDAKPTAAPDLINNELVQIFFCILYTTVFVLGVFGNVLVCYVVLRNRAMQTVTNIFITNLALSDILLCVLAVPFTPLYTFMGRWAFGRTLCHLVSFAQGCSIYISTLTLTSIAVDRFFVIIYPFHPRMKLSTCIAIIVSIWVVALLATLPYGMYMKVVAEDTAATAIVAAAAAAANVTDTGTGAQSTVRSAVNGSAAALLLNATQLGGAAVAAGDGEGGEYAANLAPPSTSATDAYMQLMVTSVTSSTAPSAAAATAVAPITATTYCEENWPSEQYRKVFGSVTTILQFVLPFFIISICYTWVSVKLNARARTKPGTKSSRREEADRDRKKRTNRMLIAMVAVFGLSWLPINVVNIFDDFYEKSNEWRFYTLFFFVAHSIAMSSTCYNPFLYAWLNENFRKEFKHVLPCFNPSNNNIINITRGYNRSDRNTCGPRLHHGNGAGGGSGVGGAGGAGADGSLDADDGDENGITQETCLPKEKLLIIPREATYGNGSGACSGGSLSPRLDTSFNSALVHHQQNSRHVDILLNDSAKRRGRRHAPSSRSAANNDDYDDGDYDSGDEQTIEMRFSETPFVSSDNTTAISMLETSTSNEAERAPDEQRDRRAN